MSILQGIIQGIIQGITEFLPISSDGHLTLFQHLTGLSGEGALFFTLMLHMGTLVAIFIVYRKIILALITEVFAMAKDLFSGKLNKAHMNPARNMIFMLVAATAPLLVFVFVKDIVAFITEDNDILVEGFCFLFTALMLFLGAKCIKGKKSTAQMKLSDALTIGFFQGFAIMPGISRSGSTISAGLLLGYSREDMVRFSFILGIPAVLGGAVLELKDALEAGIVIQWAPLLAGVAAAIVCGVLCIKLIEYLVVSNRFIIFSYYTAVLGLIVLIAGIIEHVTGQNIAVLLTGALLG